MTTLPALQHLNSLQVTFEVDSGSHEHFVHSARSKFKKTSHESLSPFECSLRDCDLVAFAREVIEAIPTMREVAVVIEATGYHDTVERVGRVQKTEDGEIVTVSEGIK